MTILDMETIARAFVLIAGDRLTVICWGSKVELITALLSIRRERYAAHSLFTAELSLVG